MNDETDRLELFRRIRASDRGSEKYLLVGVPLRFPQVAVLELLIWSKFFNANDL
jgi:hypothetical protein